MKIKQFILLIILLMVCTFFTTGCFIQEKIEFNKTREEIIKFDEEAFKLKQKHDIKNSEFDKRIYDIESNMEKHPENINLLLLDRENEKKLHEDFLDYMNTYKNEFQNLFIPEALDDFYYSKINHLNKTIEANIKYISFLENLIMYDADTFKNLSEEQVNKWVDRNDSLEAEYQNLHNEAETLELAADKIRREVYRKYNLDDFISKWQ